MNPRGVAAGGFANGGTRIDARQIDRERGPFARLALHIDGSAVLFYDAINRGQAQAGSPPALLGGEERFKYVLPRLVGHAGAVVADGQQHGGTAQHLRLSNARDFRRFHVGCANAQPAAARHGIARVGRQVDEDLAHLVRIRLHQPQRGPESRDHLDILPNHTLQHLLHAGDQHVEIEWFGFDDLLAAEREQLFRQAGGLSGSLADLPRVIQQWFVAV